MDKKEQSIEIGGRTLSLTTGHIAQQATSAVMAQYGETVVIATVVAAPLRQDLGYFPLSVEYRERLYAGGRIKGSRWVKREGRPLDEEILNARLVDRSIRPLFPSNYKKDVQVALTVMSVDMENSPDIVAALATSAALAISEIPWNGPVATVKVGLVKDEFVLNPTESQVTLSDMELVVSGTDNAIVMIENGSREITEEKIIDGISFAHDEIKKLTKFISDFAKKVGTKKEVLPKEGNKADLEKSVKKFAEGKITELISQMANKEAGYAEFDEVKYAVADEFAEDERSVVKDIFENLFKKKLREMVVKGKRPDGRKPDEIRELSAEVEILPRTHGSAIFKRGQTQVMTVGTLAGPALGQLIESAVGEEEKRYIHHYSMPPYSVGETGRYGTPSRREIGHGALAEKALLPVIPSEKEFPYTIHLVSEVLSSNGSTSMASTCGSTLALMDAGVPISAPVAGIAMGGVIDDKGKFTILTDIMGIEDANGDLDFKVAGTRAGVTALQLDVKTLDLTVDMLEKAFAQAKNARLAILDVMEAAIPKPRKTVSQYAPKVKVVTVPKEKIGEVIGPGGRMIRQIIADTGAELDIDDDGNVTITGLSEESVQKAVDIVESLVKEIEPGEIYEGEVKRIEPYGAFVEILPGKEGLVHVSEMSEEFVKDPNDIVSMGQSVKVKVKKIDDLGRVDLTMVLDRKSEPDGNRGRGDRGGSRRHDNRSRSTRNESGGGRRRDRMGERGQRSQNNRSGGPHFPVSRLVDNERTSR